MKERQMKKIIAVLIALTMLTCFIPLADADEPLRYVLIGDSIAFGSGVYNSTEACYGKIVADTNGYIYDNYAVSGFTSGNVISTLQQSEVISAVEKADIISISVGGNDFLQQNIPLLVSQAAVGIYTHLDNIEKNLYKNLATIITTIREVNPDVVILMQTLYNTHIGVLGAIYDLAIPRVNRVIYGYLDENPGAYLLLDVAAAFDGHPEYVAADTIHPSAEGNIAIAELVLAKLYELGLGTNLTPVVNAAGIDQIPFISTILKKIFDVFRAFAGMFG